MRNGINVNDDCESVESGFQHPQHRRTIGHPMIVDYNIAGRAEQHSSMWNVYARTESLSLNTESIPGHCFNGQGHKSLSTPNEAQSLAPTALPSARASGYAIRRLLQLLGRPDDDHHQSLGMTVLFVFSPSICQLVVSHYSILPIYQWEIHFPIVFSSFLYYMNAF